MERMCALVDYFSGGMGQWVECDEPIRAKLNPSGFLFFGCTLVGIMLHVGKNIFHRTWYSIMTIDSDDDEYVDVVGDEDGGDEEGMGGRKARFKGLWEDKGDVCGDHDDWSGVQKVRRKRSVGGDNDETETEATCSICLEDVGENLKHTVMTCCGHQYHKVCFDKVIRKEKEWYRCPNCRHERPVMVKTHYLKMQ